MFKLDVGTSDMANDLYNSISAQQFLIERDSAPPTRPPLAQVPDGNVTGTDELSETSSLPADEALEEVFQSPIAISVPKRPAPPPPPVVNAWTESEDRDEDDESDSSDEGKNRTTLVMSV